MNGKSTIEFFEIGREGKDGSVLDFRIMCRPVSSKQSWLAYYFDNLEEICNMRHNDELADQLRSRFTSKLKEKLLLSALASCSVCWRTD